MLKIGSFLVWYIGGKQVIDGTNGMTYGTLMAFVAYFIAKLLKVIFKKNRFIAYGIAGLAAEGVTTVENIHYVERGYERIIEKMTNLGAKIKRIED